ncbi:glycine betaine ABC transporter substrate-binding protein [Alteromonas gracilis]
MRKLVAAVAALPLLLTACGGGDDAFESEGGGGGGEVTVVGQGFTEADIMTQLYKGVLEDAGYTVTVRNFDTRDIYLKALQDGDVQVAADYLSSLTEELNRRANGDDADPVADPDAGATAETLAGLTEPLGLTPLEPAEAENANAYAVTEDFATENDLTTLTDLGELGQPVALAANADCPDRQDCQLGLASVYGIDISGFEPLGFGSAETKNALVEGEVQLGQVGTTDATLETNGLVILEDDQDWQNAENLIPVVNSAWLADNPDAQAALDELSQTLTTDDLAMLNGRVDAERELAETVAQDYLSEKGLI